MDAGVNCPGPCPDETLVRAILSMAEALDLHVTAEGIETQEQLDALLRLGCTHGQGYYLAEPAPATTLARLLGIRPGPPNGRERKGAAPIATPNLRR
jgi:EAL domain-containing protein (putative c-di-GMP-specific phosphodiesterase class I)